MHALINPNTLERQCYYELRRLPSYIKEIIIGFV